MRLWRVKPTEKGLQDLNRFFLMGSGLLTLVATVGWCLGQGFFAPVAFLFFCAGFRILQCQWTHPLWICFQAWSFFYLEIPCFWYAWSGKNLNPAHGIPIEEEAVSGRDLTLSLSFLAMFYLGFVALRVLEKRPAEVRTARVFITDQGFYRLLWVCLPILLFQLYQELDFSAQKLDQRPGFLGELLRFFCNDVAIFFALFLFNLARLNENNRQSVRNMFGLLLLFFIFQRLFIGSKSSVLVAFFIGILAPSTCAKILRLPAVVLPRAWLVLVLGPVSIFLFFWGQFFRNLVNQKSPGFNDPEKALWFVVDYFRDLSGLFEIVMYRLSSEFHRYLLLFGDFIQNGSHPMRLETASYIGKNLLNLLWPGTPFPECYFMSSMFLPQLLAQAPLEGGDSVGLTMQMNTQPFTLFGLLTFFFGLAAPLLFFLYCLVLHWFLLRPRLLFAVGGLLLFEFSLAMYGLEVVVQRALIFLAVLFWASLLITGVSWRRRPGVSPPEMKEGPERG